MSHSSQAVGPERRRAEIVTLLKEHGECSIIALAERFDVSEMTIRRDLQELCDTGRVIRTYGGATPAERISFEFKFLERARLHAVEKEHIAGVAAAMIRPGDSILLDSGTTTLAIANALPASAGLRVITTSLPIASTLFGRDGFEVVILGGSLRKDAPDLTGALTENNLELIHANVAFIGADAVDLDGGVYNGSLELGRMLQQMARSADRAYAVADHSKIGGRALMRYADLRSWSGLITDSGLNPSAAARLLSRGVKLYQPKHQEAGD